MNKHLKRVLNLQNKSISAIKIFQETIDKLRSANSEILEEKEKLASEMEELKNHEKELTDVLTSNIKIVEQVEKIIK